MQILVFVTKKTSSDFFFITYTYITISSYPVNIFQQNVTEINTKQQTVVLLAWTKIN